APRHFLDKPMTKLTFPKARAAERVEFTPLSWLLARLNDPNIAATTKDRIAAIAAPYVHPKLQPQRSGKKEKAAKAALMAGDGTSWGKDLEFKGAVAGTETLRTN